MKKKSIFSLTMVLLFFVSAVLSPVYAESEEELQKKKAEASQKKAEYEYQIDMKQNTAEGIENEINKAEEKIKTITDKVNAFDGQISEINTNLEMKNQQLAGTQAKQAEQEKDLEERLRVMYMFGNEGYASVLFSSTSFTDFIAKADMIRLIAQADRNVVNALETTAKQVKTQQEEIKADKKHLEALKQEQEIALASQNDIREQEKQLLAENQHVINELQAKVEAEQAIYDAADDELARLAVQGENEIGQGNVPGNTGENGEGNEGTGDNNGGGNENPVPDPGPAPSAGLIWPISSEYHPIEWDDMFGDRIHPVYGTWTWHSGCDMAAPGGTSVWSPGDGVVTFAGWNGGYGNCIMIAVDGGTVLFGHLSSIDVSKGQSVRQGQHVGAVGTTGTSTGNHLHLSFLVNGNYVDPLNYMHW
ncbi:Septal ring factor EnvC, activator of murein hydrolases AmiA and AmiB [Eubacterium maltosivorans]|uniref:murein hydrolase activator EnvC family protein n=1 Tax=Eubacterium maltosivorans TaxID=2041044 RepID=UPI0008916B3C|nr:M23 family metallopeptidase [Eubacterium maltosivorans]WPK80155.1 Cell division coordinator CpoB [Eubacterium maltosivorans]SDO82613.1 Septal ring factor EnvC, activator of murein hydrolases AmiA and AmiB [Eubacterium maltosivorans]